MAIEKVNERERCVQTKLMSAGAAEKVLLKGGVTLCTYPLGGGHLEKFT